MTRNIDNDPADLTERIKREREAERGKYEAQQLDIVEAAGSSYASFLTLLQKNNLKYHRPRSDVYGVAGLWFRFEHKSSVDNFTSVNDIKLLYITADKVSALNYEPDCRITAGDKTL